MQLLIEFVRFKAIKHHPLDMNLKLLHLSPNLDFLDRENVVLISVLEDQGKALIIGNTHILFNVKKADIKLGLLSLEKRSNTS